MNRRYKLIKTFPGSAPLGTIINLKNVAFGITHNYTDYPEFWQLIEEKEYEVTQIKGCKEEGGYIYDRNPDGTYNPWDNPYKSLEYALSIGSTIYKVKRLSDGIEFKIGDKVHNPKCSSQKFTIEEFYLDCNEEHLLCGPGHINITKIEHYKESLFLDELGNEVFEGDSFWFTNKNFELKYWDSSKMDTLNANMLFLSNALIFSSKQSCEKYIEDNKPRFSKKQILDVLDTIDCDTNKESMIVLYIKLRLGL